jgi:hypothetical protein
MNQTVNKVREVVYVAENFTTGLTDVTLVVREADGTILTPAVTEQSGGVYIASYTPTVVGVAQEKITSVVNGDKVIRSVVIQAVDESDISASVAAVKTDVDSSTTAIESAVTGVGTQVTGVKTELDSVQTTVNSIRTTVNSISAGENHKGGYFA